MYDLTHYMYFLQINQTAFKNNSLETGLSDCHMLIVTTLSLTFIKLLPKTVRHSSYKKFNEIVLPHELD